MAEDPAVRARRIANRRLAEQYPERFAELVDQERAKLGLPPSRRQTYDVNNRPDRFRPDVERFWIVGPNKVEVKRWAKAHGLRPDGDEVRYVGQDGGNLRGSRLQERDAIVLLPRWRDNKRDQDVDGVIANLVLFARMPWHKIVEEAIHG